MVDLDLSRAISRAASRRASEMTGKLGRFSWLERWAPAPTRLGAAMISRIAPAPSRNRIAIESSAV